MLITGADIAVRNEKMYKGYLPNLTWKSEEASWGSGRHSDDAAV
jgi:hypothetical protein